MLFFQIWASLRPSRLDRRPMRQGRPIRHWLLRRWWCGQEPPVCPSWCQTRPGLLGQRLGQNESYVHEIQVWIFQFRDLLVPIQTLFNFVIVFFMVPWQKNIKEKWGKRINKRRTYSNLFFYHILFCLYSVLSGYRPWYRRAWIKRHKFFCFLHCHYNLVAH